MLLASATIAWGGQRLYLSQLFPLKSHQDSTFSAISRQIRFYATYNQDFCKFRNFVAYSLCYFRVFDENVFLQIFAFFVIFPKMVIK
ncbi:hypothetical protein T11_11927 [Trichinella zimbabwensis]|uniref:Uncharacterized protein n=1 Tax=Trichinella zimbabwensis TaxID=268475 RepID=A0A0V1GNR1_9BILA|nr:hypothetical protein T11_11927 [Trichinella zimbabwensis]